MPIADLVSNIVGSIGAAINGPKQLPKYPNFPKIGVQYEDVKAEHWFSPPQDTYQLTVETADEAQKGEDSLGFVDSIVSFFDAPQDVGESGFGPFKFPIPPQEIMQEEEFAVSVKPTQGGTVVRHSGNRYKTLVLSGTTGVQPFRSLTGIDRKTGRPWFQPDELKYRSGYEVFQHLRAWIKAYHEQKKTDPVKFQQLRMIWKNFKDWEFLVVEPLRFKMDRSAQKPLEYDYTITFKVTGHLVPPPPSFNFLELIDKGLEEAARAIEMARGLMLKNQEVIRATAGEIDNVLENLNKLSLAVKATGGVLVTLSDVSNKIIFNTTTNLQKLKMAFAMVTALGKTTDSPSAFEKGGLAGASFETLPGDISKFKEDVGITLKNKPNATDTLKKVLDNMGDAKSQIPITDLPAEVQAAVAEEQANAALVSAEEVAEIKAEIEAIATEFTNAVGLGDPTINSVKGYTPPAETATEGELTDQAVEIMFAFKEAISGLDSILSSDEMFDTNAELYAKSSSNGASTLGQGIFAFPNPNTGIKIGIVPKNATLEKIAQVELGESARWTELAELNALKFPFILDDEEGSPKVNFEVKSIGYYDPSYINNLAFGFRFVVAASPTPAGGWIGKANRIAQYEGGDKTLAASWRFTVPEEGTIVEVLDREETYQYLEGVWAEIDLAAINVDAVLRPGDNIKIPTNLTPPPEAQTRGPRDSRFNRNLSAAEKALQVDLKITGDNDLDLNPSGDLNVATGYENGAQAVVLKLTYEKRDLIKFPTIGAGIVVGRKMPDINQLRTNIYSSIIQDPRVKDVRNIRLESKGGELRVAFDVIFKDIQDPVPITIPV